MAGNAVVLIVKLRYTNTIKNKNHTPTLFVSIRRTTGFEPFYTVIATVTINLIVAVAIVLLNLYVAAEISYLIL